MKGHCTKKDEWKLSKLTRKMKTMKQQTRKIKKRKVRSYGEPLSLAYTEEGRNTEHSDCRWRVKLVQESIVQRIISYRGDWLHDSTPRLHIPDLEKHVASESVIFSQISSVFLVYFNKNWEGRGRGLICFIRTVVPFLKKYIYIYMYLN